MANEFLCENKIFVIQVLSGDATFILQHIQKDKLVTDREYNEIYGCLKSSQNQEKTAIDIIDLMRRKGEDYCNRFLDLLQKTPEIIETFPKLRYLNWATTLSEVPPNTQAGSKTRIWQSRTTDYHGYICNVSHIMRGKMKTYFTAVILEEFKRKTLMIFRTQLRDQFVWAERTRTSVKLEKVEFRTKYKFEIFTERSTFSVLDNSPFEYNINDNAKVEHMNLAALKMGRGNKENARRNKVDITVEVIRKLQERHCVTRAQKMLPMMKYLVGDIVANQTTTAHLVIWDHNNTFEERKWYRVTNVSVSWYRDQLVLNTTPSSTLANVPSGGKCNMPPGMIECQEFKGKIIGHWLSEVHTCPEGHRLDGIIPFVRTVTCEKCPMTYLLSSVKKIFRGKLSINSNEKNRVFCVEDNVIRKVLGGRREELTSVKDVVDALFELPPVRVTVLSDNVLSITALTQDVATQKSNGTLLRQQRI